MVVVVDIGSGGEWAAIMQFIECDEWSEKGANEWMSITSANL